MELVLSLAGYGYSKSFFVRWKAAGQTVYLANSHYCEHFVPKELSRTPEPCVLGRKGDSTIRIFVLGSSAAYGDPEPAYGFCRQLEVLLNEHAGGKSFEVINAAVTAMNSHVVRRIAQDCAKHQPDLFIVWMGNNEVVGPYGPPTLPGSLYASRRFINACITAKKETRIGQLAEEHQRELCVPRARPEKKWQGMESFLTSRIAADDPKLHGLLSSLPRQPQRHRSDGAALRRGCPSLHGPDQHPVLCPVRLAAQGGPDARTRSPNGTKRSRRAGALSRRRISPGRWRPTRRPVRSTIPMPIWRSALGRCLEALGKTEEARRKFVEARDRDVLRFRADSSILRVIRETAQAHAAQGVRLLDLETVA